MRLRGRERVSTTVSGWLPAGAPYVFNPLDLSPALWLDAADTATITASGSPLRVSQWDDKSGNGRNVTQATGANQPESGVTTVNGRNVIDLNGSYFFNLPFSSSVLVGSGSDTTIMAVITATATQNTLISYNAQTTTNRLVIHPSFGGSWFLDVNNTSNGRLTGTQATITSAAVVSYRRSGAAMSYRRNGSTIGSRNNASTTIATHVASGFLGQIDGPIPYRLNGIVAELIVFPTGLSATNEQNMETYLKNKWATP
jgi:hypothetical protein